MADRLLWRAVRDGGGWTVVLAGVATVGASAELLLPLFLAKALDGVLGRAGAGGWLAGVLALALILVLIYTDSLADIAGGAGVARATAKLRHRLLRHVLALDPDTVRRYAVGDLVGRLVAQVADAGNAGPAAVLAVTALLPSVGSLVALTLLDLWLGITFVVGLLLLAVLMRTFVTDASAAQAGYQQAQGALAGRLLEALAGARTIAAAGTIDAEIGRVLSPLPELRVHGGHTWQILARAAGRAATVAPLLQLAVVAAAGLAVADGRLTLGGMLAALQYAALGSGLGAVVAMLNRIVRTRAGCRRAAEVLAEPVGACGVAELPAGPGTLELRDVTVRDIDGHPLLDRIDLRIPGGLVVAVVGRSGAGKSLLAAVAGRLRTPDAGDVWLDGIALPELKRSALRGAVGYGFERPVLVGDTIAEAVGLGSDPGPLARAAAIDDFVERLPDGYASRLDDTPMSGGETQRLGLARALRAERLLILDDATSSVDTATEHRMSRALTAHADRRTRLIVTHRAATAARADLVAWLDGGRVRGLASHEVLWRDPAYRAVFQP